MKRNDELYGMRLKSAHRLKERTVREPPTPIPQTKAQIAALQLKDKV